jgi:hypothetical protein
MRALPHLLSLALVPSAACVTEPPDLGEHEDELERERAILIPRIRALLPDHGIVPNLLD